MKLKNNKGFTLIELSIVLVIIGLIIGGILTGQELIQGAGVRATMQQIVKYNSAVNTFQSKYNALPGDFSTAATYIASATNGDGNGVIGGIAGPATVSALSATVPTVSATSPIEYINFWAMLSTLGLIEGNIALVSTVPGTFYTLNTSFPASKVNANAGIFAYGNTNDNINYYHIGVKGSTSAILLTTADALSPGNAYAIDSKIDDGVANSGIVQARGGTGGVETAWSVNANGSNSLSSSNATGCIVGSGFATTQTQYNTAANISAVFCQLRIRIN